MNETNRILKVPRDSVLRNKLRIEAQILAIKLKLVPPLAFKQMEQIAFDLLKKLQISFDYIDFTIVLLGNESWRKTVEAIPFKRRLLLLPQCLRDNAKCMGIMDELGLNCTACKSCSIDDVLSEADKLGYATLVAEGTTVAMKLVEEGAIDAVIGVSCMAVLKRSFGTVSNSAIPVIGLPLLYDGCENTKVDLVWLYKELNAYTPNKILHPISTYILKNEINQFFSNGNLDHYFNTEVKTDGLAKEFLKVGGQRMRPLLTALSYKAYSNASKDTILHPLLLIIECFHKASLIHDDIEDNADTRYNQPTAHKKHGTAQAINLGDYLIGKGYRILADLPIDGELLAKSLKIISDSHVKLAQGQSADILFSQRLINPGLKDILQIFKHKTGEAIKVAVLLGASIGGADDSELQILSRFSELFGVAYQIRDDLNEFRGEGKDENISDYPLLIALLNDIPESGLNGNTAFRKKIIELGLDKKADEILHNYIELCYSELDKLDNARLRLNLYGVLGKIFKQTNVHS